MSAAGHLHGFAADCTLSARGAHRGASNRWLSERMDGVRAAGLRDAAFEQLVGRDRYRWLRAPGNRKVLEHDGTGVQIVDPGAAAVLLDLASEPSGQRRRVLFLCACEFPVDDAGVARQRVEVGRLVLAAARGRGLDATVVE